MPTPRPTVPVVPPVVVVTPVETKAPSMAPSVVVVQQASPPTFDPVLVTAIVVPIISCFLLLCCALVWQRQRKTIKNLKVAAQKAQRERKERRSGVVESGSLKKAVSYLKGRNSTSRSSCPSSQPSVGNINVVTIDETSPSHMTITRPKSSEFTTSSSPLCGETEEAFSCGENMQALSQETSSTPELVLHVREGGRDTGGSSNTNTAAAASTSGGYHRASKNRPSNEPALTAVIDELPPAHHLTSSASHRTSNSPSRKRLAALTSTSFSMSRRGLFPAGIFIPNEGGTSTSLSGSKSGRSSPRMFRRASSEEGQLDYALAQLGIDESNKALLNGPC